MHPYKMEVIQLHKTVVFRVVSAMTGEIHSTWQRYRNAYNAMVDLNSKGKVA